MFGIVVNEDGYKVAFVVLKDNEPQDYTLRDNEYIIADGWQIANTMGKPHWTGTNWEDLEPPQQIDICPTKTTEEKLEELIGEVSLMDELIANLTLEVIENE